MTTGRASRLLARGLVVLLAVFLQLSAAIADAPSAEQTARLPAAPGAFCFTSPEAEASREGYVTIEWSEYPGAFSYRLVDGDGTELYRGPFVRAFVSGLPDGKYVFYASALDASGAVLAETSEPYRLTVEHWSLRQAWLLFSIGLVVFLSLVVVLFRGAFGAGKAGLEAKRPFPERSPEVKE